MLYSSHLRFFISIAVLRMNQFYQLLLVSTLILSSVNFCKASLSNCKTVLSCSKQKEVKKTKTAPISPACPPHSVVGDSPSILISPPVEESSTSPGPCFVKSLTTSMTLDRRKSSKKQPAQPLSGSISPRTAQRKMSAVGERMSQRKSSPSGDEPPRLLIKNVMSKSDPGAGAKRPPAPPISKIALLSSFFERKAKQAATGEKDPKFNLACMRGRSRRPNL